MKYSDKLKNPNHDMRPTFTLFQNHKDYAHSIWSRHFKKGAIALDATCGNGHDTLMLCHLCIEKGAGQLFCFDIQEQAIINTKELLKNNFDSDILSRVSYFHQSHDLFPQDLPQCDLIVYNLGYLPGGEKTITTRTSTTLESLKSALKLLSPGGLISMMCYPGHKQGENEEAQLLEFTNRLDPKTYLCCFHKIINRYRAPSLILINKKY